MRQIAAYQAESQENGTVKLSRCFQGRVEETLVTDWLNAVGWLAEELTAPEGVFTVTFDLKAFSSALFTLVPPEVRKEIDQKERWFYQDVKVFEDGSYRFLGITTTVPWQGNVWQRSELNLTALSWWVSEEEPEPTTVRDTWVLGMRIVRALDQLDIVPTKLTTPVAAFETGYLPDARQFPTIWSWPEEKIEAMKFAEEMMRFEWRAAYKMGLFESSHLFDLAAAYPSKIARLPSTDDCRCEHSDARLAWAQWGLVRGLVEVTADISPLVYEDADGTRLMPKGRWLGTFTTREIDFLEKWGIGSFNLIEGWFFKFGSSRPWSKPMHWLYYQRSAQTDPFVATMVKKMAQGTSGKLDQDTAGKLGDFYNPILAAIVRSETRLTVGKFIYEHNLQNDLLAVQVDSVLAARTVGELPPATGMGSWRYEGEEPAIVLSKGATWRPGKKPQGISFEQVLTALVNDPESAYYEFKTAGGRARSIDLLIADVDRNFERLPECGRDLLENTYPSTATTLE